MLETRDPVSKDKRKKERGQEGRGVRREKEKSSTGTPRGRACKDAGRSKPRRISSCCVESSES